jgi:TRAP-type uncharacterized transport system substrate-binding protein
MALHNKWLSIALSFLMAFSPLMLVSGEVMAKKYSSSSSKSSWGSSKSSYKKSYKPAKSMFDRKTVTKTKAIKKKPYQVASTKKPAAKKVVQPKLTVKQKAAKQKVASAKAAKKKKAMERQVAKTERKKFAAKNKAPVLTSKQKTANQVAYKKDPAYRNVKTMDTYRYQNNRNSYYDNLGWTPSPYIVRHHTTSSYGMWDSMFMWSMLGNMHSPSYSSTYYHNQNSYAFRQWRREANEMARDNDELRQQLRDMDRQVARMDGPQVAGTIGEGIPVAAYASIDAVTTPDVSQFRLGVGSDNGMYTKACEYMKMTDSDHDANFKCIKNEGSAQILSKIMKGELDGGFVQADVLVQFADKLDRLKALQATAYKELVFLITPKNSNIENVKDFTGNTNKKLYTMGSGSRFTMQSFAKLDASYSNATRESIKNKLPMSMKSFQLIANKQNAAVMVVCAINCPLLKELESSSLSNKLKMIPVNDWNFNDKTDRFGNVVYDFTTVSGSTYPNLIPASMMGLKTGEVETLSLSAVFIASNAWLEAKSEDARLMMEFMLDKSLPQIRNIAGDSI